MNWPVLKLWCHKCRCGGCDDDGFGWETVIPGAVVEHVLQTGENFNTIAYTEVVVWWILQLRGTSHQNNDDDNRETLYFKGEIDYVYW